MGDHFDPAMSRAKIKSYLDRAGIDFDEDTLSSIKSWNSLQQFVALPDQAIAAMPPVTNTRLKTYGLDADHPVVMLVRHVVS
jgi:hypothetical protein